MKETLSAAACRRDSRNGDSWAGGSGTPSNLDAERILPPRARFHPRRALTRADDADGQGGAGPSCRRRERGHAVLGQIKKPWVVSSSAGSDVVSHASPVVVPDSSTTG